MRKTQWSEWVGKEISLWISGKSDPFTVTLLEVNDQGIWSRYLIGSVHMDESQGSWTKDNLWFHPWSSIHHLTVDVRKENC
jgi:hypothetical protein